MDNLTGTEQNIDKEYKNSDSDDIEKVSDNLGSSTNKDDVEQSENADINTEQSKKSDDMERLVYINFTPPEPDDDEYWDEVGALKPHAFPGKLLWLTLLVVVITAIFGYTLVLQRGKGVVTNIFGGRKNIEFTLPIAETPEVGEKYQNGDGSYTAAGVAKAALPGVVQIKVYADNAVIPSVQGSGIIMSEDGYIVTNAHVVSGSNYGITVMLYDKSEYSAQVVGTDDSTDIAVLKIPTNGLTAAQFADSDTCELGDEVIAIGSPAGFENSVTKGIISGLNRQVRAENSTTPMECIQIDAAINPGNSGGPLFNMWGQVIGITSSKLASTKYDNIGFAISVNSAKPIIEQLMEDGFIPDKGRIGISYYAMTQAQAELCGVENGIYVADIDPECKVAETDIKIGDIITEIDGTPLSDTEDVAGLMKDKRVGDTVVCKVYRPELDEDEVPTGSGETFEIEVELSPEKTSMIRTDNADDDSE